MAVDADGGEINLLDKYCPDALPAGGRLHAPGRHSRAMTGLRAQRRSILEPPRIPFRIS